MSDYSFRTCDGNIRRDHSDKVQTKVQTQMTRYEITTPHKSFAGCEPTLEDAKAYVTALVDAGVEVLNVRYYDNDTRIADIRAGRF